MDTNEQLSALFATAIEQNEAVKSAINNLSRERNELNLVIESIKIESNKIKKSSIKNINLLKSWMLIILFFSIIINAIDSYIIFQLKFSIQSEIEELNLEKYKLKINIENLKKQGGKIKFNNCDGRLCIEASKNQGGKEQNWNGAAWKYVENDTELVIPNGY
jgi:hypothetical protein